jgi:cyclic lactone autoinducer peptide
MKKLIATLFISLLLIAGSASIAGACWWGYHQPELPQKPQ